MRRRLNPDLRLRALTGRGIAPTALLVVLAAACGTSAAGDGDVDAACDAFVAVDRAFSIEEDPEAGIAALEDFVVAAPDDVATAVEPVLSLLEEDLEAALESPELAAAESAADAYALENCGDSTFDVDALNFAFSGIPTEIDAGRVVFDLSNESSTGEFHEAILLRKNDGVDGTAHDTLASALGDETSAESAVAALESFTMVGIGWAEPDDPDGDVFAVDLDSGEYIVVCLLPVDSPETIEPYFMGEAVDQARHFDEGMFASFTVP